MRHVALRLNILLSAGKHSKLLDACSWVYPGRCNNGLFDIKIKEIQGNSYSMHDFRHDNSNIKRIYRGLSDA